MPRVRKSAFVSLHLHGAPMTMAALSSWPAVARRQFTQDGQKIAKEVKNAIKRVLMTGSSSSTPFTPIAALTKIKKSHEGLPHRPFVSSPPRRLVNAIHVTAAAPTGLGGKVLGKVTVEVRGNIQVKRQAMALRNGSRRTVKDKKQSLAIWYATGKQIWVPPGAVMVTRPRDFLTAGIRDSYKQIENGYERALAKTNLTVTAAMPKMITGTS